MGVTQTLYSYGDSMSIEAMKQALEALEVATTPLARDRQTVLKAQIELLLAIEQAEKQEPVACKHKRYSNDVTEDIATCYDCGAEGRMRFVANYTAPPRKEFGDLLMKLHEKYKHQHNHFHVEAVNFWEKNNGV